MFSVNDLVPEKLRQLLLSVVPAFYVVGGAVRDNIAPHPQQPRDVDIVILHRETGWTEDTYDKFLAGIGTLGEGTFLTYKQYPGGNPDFQRMWKGLVKLDLNDVFYDILFAHAGNIADVLTGFDYNLNQVAVRSDGKFIEGHTIHPATALVRHQDVSESRAKRVRFKYHELGYTGEVLTYDTLY